MTISQYSSFTWLDYSEHERRKMLEVIHSFDEKGTRDELGIGIIRDGLADLLFPGTGTVQTRARYFLFTPWIYMDLEKNKTPSREVVERARKREIELIYALEKGGEKSAGIIGIEAQEKLQRLPSNIYWQGLGAWGIRRYLGSQDQYHRGLDSWYRQQAERTRADRGESGESEGLKSNWHLAIPTAPDGWRWKTEFPLTRAEAKFLRDGILNRKADSLLAHLVTIRKPLAESEFCWNSDVYRDFSEANRTQVNHARAFSEVIHGAALIYNLLLSKTARKKDLVQKYHQKIRIWSETLEERADRIADWDISSFWKLLSDQNIRVTPRTNAFVCKWIQCVQNTKHLQTLADSKDVHKMIRDREVELKKSLARLENPRALELWNEAAGAGQLDFRWTVSLQIVNDILEGLGHA
jgi:hypothetical protein